MSLSVKCKDYVPMSSINRFRCSDNVNNISVTVTKGHCNIYLIKCVSGRFSMLPIYTNELNGDSED